MFPSQAFIILVSYWSLLWIQSDEGYSEYYVIGFGIIIMLLYLTFGLRMYPFTNLLLTSNQKLNNKAIQGLAETDSSYFDTNNSGVLNNRFTIDSSEINNRMVLNYSVTVSTIVYLIGITASASVIIPYMLIVIPILCLFGYYLFRYFNNVLIQLRNIEIVSKGPLLSNYNSVLLGYSTMSIKLIQLFLRRTKNKFN